MDILVLHPGALGDIILSLPALAILRRRFPRAGITLAANLDFAEAVAAGYADRLLSFSALPLHNLFGSDPVPEADRQFWSAFDRIVSWTGFGDPQFVRNLDSLHTPALVLPWRPRPGDTRHVARIFVDSIHPWVGDELEVPAPVVSIPSAEQARGEEWLIGKGWKAGRSMVALHPGAGSVEKQWPMDNFRELAARVIAAGSQVLIIEGPAEHGVSERMVVPGGSMIAAKGLPLLTVVAVLGCCAAFVGNDSGISHLASALSVPSLVLFGPTNPQQWAPAGAHVSVLAAEQGRLERLSVNSVWDRLKANLY